MRRDDRTGRTNINTPCCVSSCLCFALLCLGHSKRCGAMCLCEKAVNQSASSSRRERQREREREMEREGAGRSTAPDKEPATPLHHYTTKLHFSITKEPVYLRASCGFTSFCAFLYGAYIGRPKARTLPYHTRPRVYCKVARQHLGSARLGSRNQRSAAYLRPPPATICPITPIETLKAVQSEKWPFLLFASLFASETRRGESHVGNKMKMIITSSRDAKRPLIPA